jgi:PIN domain nuclease of toxin-antitoxin system
MKVLIDTHTFLWMAAEPEKLSSRAREVCATETLVLSVASVWEISIKYRTGRLPLPLAPESYIPRQVSFLRATILPIHFVHAIRSGRIDSGHKDPFDRMLAAQCFEEGLPCVTRDPFFRTCGVSTIW